MSELVVDCGALAVQAATGLFAVVVLLVVMNWFFHGIYWSGWINPQTPAVTITILPRRDDDAGITPATPAGS